MLGLLALLLSVDGGSPASHAGIVAYGVSRATESWGPTPQPRVPCDLTFDEQGMKLTGALTAEDVRATALKYQGSIEVCAAPAPNRDFTLTLQVKPTGGVLAAWEANASVETARLD